MTSPDVDATITRLVAAQRDGDAAALQDQLADDFLLAGPLGFLLDKARGWSSSAPATCATRTSPSTTRGPPAAT